MNSYDPLKTPDAGQWLALGEQERMLLVEKYHKKARIAMPNHIVHASMHAVVENQLAEGIPIVKEVLSRLMGEGLDRHEALHAIASVMTKHIYDALRGDQPDGNLGDQYLQELRTFTKADWLKSNH